MSPVIIAVVDPSAKQGNRKKHLKTKKFIQDRQAGQLTSIESDNTYYVNSSRSKEVPGRASEAGLCVEMGIPDFGLLGSGSHRWINDVVV
jgi:hypothetical protein